MTKTAIAGKPPTLILTPTSYQSEIQYPSEAHPHREFTSTDKLPANPSLPS
jgi:hypothetical protein